jgi:hypothetical protein
MFYEPKTGLRLKNKKSQVKEILSETKAKVGLTLHGLLCTKENSRQLQQGGGTHGQRFE